MGAKKRPYRVLCARTAAQLQAADPLTQPRRRAALWRIEISIKSYVYLLIKLQPSQDGVLADAGDEAAPPPRVRLLDAERDGRHRVLAV